MRLLAGLLAAAPFRTVLTGDAQPVDRARWSASPSRCGRWAPPSRPRRRPCTGRRSRAGRSTGIDVTRADRRRAQVKGAVLLAGLAAEGETTVDRAGRHPRPHRAGARARSARPVAVEGRRDRVERFQHEGVRRRRCRATSRRPPSSSRPPRSRARELTIRRGRPQPEPAALPRGDGADGRPHRSRVSSGEELGEPVGELWVAPVRRPPRGRGSRRRSCRS